MAAAPGYAAVLADLVWCLGLGLFLGAGRDTLKLLFGNTSAVCFLCDLLAFSAAAVLLCGFSAGVSASGVARWYMAAGMLAGALAWRWAVSAAISRVSAAVVYAALLPCRLMENRVIRPVCRRVKRGMKKLFLKKPKKKRKKEKKLLQNPTKVLYN